MARFAYRAKRPNGEIVEGVLEAENRRLVVSKLQGMKVFPITIEEEGGRGLQKEVNLRSFVRVRFTDVVNFTRQLSDLTKAGMPLVRSLDVLVEQNESEKMKNMIRAMKNDVAGGTPFSDALAKYPKQFSDLYSSMVRGLESWEVTSIPSSTGWPTSSRRRPIYGAVSGMRWLTRSS